VKPLIEVEKVSKRYNVEQTQQETMLREAIVRIAKAPFRRRTPSVPFWALKDVSFLGRTGEVIGIVGRNGAGKSTLLKILSKITYPTVGCVKVRGRVASLLEIGTGFHDELTGRENIYLNGTVLGMKKREVERKLEQIVEFSGVHQFIDMPLKRYSSGMALRLGFAVAAHLEADVLMVDEVLAVGDAEFQKKCLARLGDLHKSGRTVLFVSHNLPAVEHLCPRTIWIDKGQVRADGDTRDVIGQYLALFAGAQTVTDLNARHDREGTGELRFTAVEFLDKEGQIKALSRIGDALTVRLHYRANQTLRDAQFGIWLSTESGSQITSVGTADVGYDIPLVPAGEGHIDVAFDFINLMPGRYWVSLWATGPHHHSSTKNCWDVLERCAAIDLEATDFYKSGRGIGQEYGLIVLPCKWSDSITDGRGSDEICALEGKEREGQ
jgi:lipopolysaccharide transport system ATP-binding protein